MLSDINTPSGSRLFIGAQEAATNRYRIILISISSCFSRSLFIVISYFYWSGRAWQPTESATFLTLPPAFPTRFLMYVLFNCTETLRGADGAAQTSQDYTYLTVPMRDDEETELRPNLERCFQFIDSAISTDSGVLVHWYSTALPTNSFISSFTYFTD